MKNKRITAKELCKLENMKPWRLQEIRDYARGLHHSECYYFECCNGQLYAGGIGDFQNIKKGFRADYCVYQGKYYLLGEE